MLLSNIKVKEALTIGICDNNKLFSATELLHGHKFDDYTHGISILTNHRQLVDHSYNEFLNDWNHRNVQKW